MLILGIDIGSSFIKTSVLDLEKGSIGFEQKHPTPEFIDTSGPEREIPMDKVTTLVKAMIDSVIACHTIEGILFSVQMHGFRLYSGNRGITEYISWQDMRGYSRDGIPDTASQIRALAGDKLLRRNGVELRNSHSLCPLYHLLERQQYSGSLQFSMMGDALIRDLTGEVTSIHPTVAASSALYDLEKKDWNRDLIRILSLERIEFPHISSGKEAVAYYKIDGRKIPVYAAVGDHQAAVLGCEAGDGDLIINIGTGGQISFIDEGLSFGDYETRPYFSGRTLRALTQLPSGRSLNILMNLVLDTGNHIFNINVQPNAELWNRVNNFAEEFASITSVQKLKLDMSFFDPSGASIMGANSRNLTIGSLFAAAYQNMADSYFKALAKLGLNGKNLRTIIGAGGVLRKTPLLQRMISECFSLPLKLAPNSQDVMYGLLRLGRWQTGIDRLGAV